MIRHLGAALRVLLRSGLSTSNAMEKMRAENAGCVEVDELIEFVAA